MIAAVPMEYSVHPRPKKMWVMIGEHSMMKKLSVAMQNEQNCDRILRRKRKKYNFFVLIEKILFVIFTESLVSLK